MFEKIFREIYQFVDRIVIRIRMSGRIDELTRTINESINSDERRNAFNILQMIGSRDEGAAERLYAFYCEEIRPVQEWYPDILPEFSLEQCKKIIEDDRIFEYYTTVFLTICRDSDGLDDFNRRHDEFVAMIG